MSARYAGANATMDQNREKLLQNLSGIQDRKAFFRCVLCFYDGASTIFGHGLLEGSIVDSPVGTGGFGYDDLFMIQQHQQTLAQLKEETFFDTHRKRAFASLNNLISS